MPHPLPQPTPGAFAAVPCSLVRERTDHGITILWFPSQRNHCGRSATPMRATRNASMLSGLSETLLRHHEDLVDEM